MEVWQSLTTIARRYSGVSLPLFVSIPSGYERRATREDIARALLNEDRSQLEYYAEITRDMVGRVLTNRQVVKRDGAILTTDDCAGFLSARASNSLKNLCLAMLFLLPPLVLPAERARGFVTT